MKSLHSLNSFSGGALSPKLDARVDNKAYAAGMRQSLNMIVYKQGPLTRRPGTQYIGTALVQGTAVRDEKFQFSPDTGFTLYFGDGYLQFASNGQMVTVSTAPDWVSGPIEWLLGTNVTDPSNSLIYTCSVPHLGGLAPHLDPASWVQNAYYTVRTPYSGQIPMGGTVFDADVFGLKFQEINDVTYITHPDYAPYVLTRFGDTDWTLIQTPFQSPALLDQNATDTIITPSALQGDITLTASAPPFVPFNFYNVGNSVEVTSTAGAFVIGDIYVIVSVGSTDFTAIGAASNTVGVQFTATGVGSGSGTAKAIYDCVLAHVSASTWASDYGAIPAQWQQVQIFHSGQEGGTWQLAALRNSAYIEYDGVASTGFAAGTSSQIQALGDWQVHSYGVWSADIAIQRSLDGGQTFDTVASVTGRSDRNVDLSGTAVQVAIFQIVVSNVQVPVNPGATNPRVVFECEDAFLYGTVLIDTVVNGYSATGVVLTQLTDTNALAPQWVSGTSYTSSQEVSYLFVNYTCTSNVSGSTPPPQDSTHWSSTQPGGTEYWSEAAWSNYRGFPAALCSFQQRMIYGGSGFEPQRIWGTVTNDLQNFALGDQTLATDAFAFDLNAPGRGPIFWLAGQLALFCGFSGAEWVVTSGSSSQTDSSGASITPTSINAVEHSTWGSSQLVEPQVIGDAIIYTQRQATTLRQMLFSVYTAKYMSQDLSALSDHLLSAGIVQIAYQPRWRRQGMIWCLTRQGTLCALTYDLDQGIFGWHPHATGFGQVDANGVPIANDNGFESVCVIDGQNRDEDEVWVVANRLIGGVQTRYYERINPFNWEEVFTAAPNPPIAVPADAFYVDCGITVTNPGTLTIGGLSQLIGRTVIGLADGYPIPPLVVNDSGQVTLPASIPTTVGTVQLGLPILYYGQPMRIDDDARAGNTQGLVKQISDVFIRVWNSMGGSIWNGTSDYPTWVSGSSYTPGNGVISPLTRLAYNCTVANSGTTDPSLSSNWVQTARPNVQPAVPIPYIPNTSTPFAMPVFVSEPTDIRITPMLNASPDTDPVIIVTGNDALPLTVLGAFLKYDVVGTP